MADGDLNPSNSAVQKALCRQELQKHCCRRTRQGNRGDSRGYRVLASGPDRCSWNATLEGGDEGHLGRAETSCQVHPGPSVSPVVY